MIDKIRYWCHKILPLVYDDSLSYYEFLCKMNAKLNEVIDSTNGLVEAWEKFQAELEKAWEDYKSALTAEWADYRAEMDLKYSTLVGTVNTEINAMKTDISNFKTDISTQITTFEAKVEGDYAEFTAYIEEKINAFIAKYNAEIAKIPDEITRLVNAWWQNEENYNKLVIDVANSIGTSLTSGAVTFSDVHAMMESNATTLPAKSLAVCANYYNRDGIYTLWVIVSGNVSDGVSRLPLSPASDRTAILLSERNSDTLGLRGIAEPVGRSRLLTMCKNNYKYLKIVSNSTTLYIPNTADVGAASIMPLEIYGTNKEITVDFSFHGGDCNTVESISTLTATFGGADSQFSSQCALKNLEVDSRVACTFQHVDWHEVWWRDNSARDTPIVLAPTATDHRPQMKNCLFTLFGVRSYITLQNTTANGKGIEITGNSFYRTDGAAIGNSYAFIEINGNTSVVTLRDNFCRTGEETSPSVIFVLAKCKNFQETGKAIICEGNRNEVGGASHPMTMFTGDIPSDIVYVNNVIRFGNTYTLSDIPTTGNFAPARVMGVTHPIGYLRTAENRSVIYGHPLTLTYPDVSYWTANDGAISLSSDTNALYKVTFRATVAVSGQKSVGNAKISLKGRDTESRTFTLLSSMQSAQISLDFYWGTGGGFTVEVSSETEAMTVVIIEAELRIERLK